MSSPFRNHHSYQIQLKKKVPEGDCSWFYFRSNFFRRSCIRFNEDLIWYSKSIFHANECNIIDLLSWWCSWNFELFNDMVGSNSLRCRTQKKKIKTEEGRYFRHGKSEGWKMPTAWNRNDPHWCGCRLLNINTLKWTETRKKILVVCSTDQQVGDSRPRIKWN